MNLAGDRLSSIGIILGIITIATSACSSSLINTSQKEDPPFQSIAIQDNSSNSGSDPMEMKENILNKFHETMSHYQIAPGDILEVSFLFSSLIESSEYRLGVGDELDIEFPYHPETTRTVVIRPDGKITLPRKGEFLAAGLLPSELTKEISDRFTDIFKDSQVTVNVKKFASKADVLKNAISSPSKGYVKTYPVDPQGYLYLPLLEGMRASGMEIDDLRKEINLAYGKVFRNLSISIQVESFSGQRVFVFGEVQKPGMLSMARPMTLMQAISASGGILRTGSLEKVLVVNYNEEARTRSRFIDLAKLTTAEGRTEDILLRNNSVVFVPMTGIAKMDLIVEQYVKNLFLFNGFNFGVNYELNKRLRGQ